MLAQTSSRLFQLTPAHRCLQDKIRTPPIGVPGERTGGCKYYCDRQTARTESKWTSQERGELYGNQGTLKP